MSKDPRVQFDVVVAGGGVVGLAVARELALRGLATLVVERHDRLGTETSTRNSGVIHSGLYYPTASLKAQLCVRGREILYAYAAARGIAHRRCGKLIVAQAGQLAALESLHRRGEANGVTGLHRLDAAAVARLEPAVRCAAALLVPETGILDVHDLLLALQADLEAHDGIVALQATVEAVEPCDAGFNIRIGGHGSASTLTATRFVNSAGLGALDLARSIRGYACTRPSPRAYAKGNYFTCPGRPFSRLVYPMPNQAGLGIHATLDMAGHVRFGPDVEWVERPDYVVDAGRRTAFETAIREYWPELPADALRPDYSGIRPKLVGPGVDAADFVVEGRAQHGIAGLVNLLGIESPGLTACLALGEHVAGMLEAEAQATRRCTAPPLAP